jgi:K+-sensing histidine kinase KdpD
VTSWAGGVGPAPATPVAVTLQPGTRTSGRPAGAIRILPSRSLWGAAAGLAVLGVGTAALMPFRSSISRATPALVFVLPVVAAGLVGRRAAAVVTAIVAAVVYSFAFVPPYDRWSISRPEDVVALGVFIVVALVVGTLVAIESDRRASAEDRAEELRRLLDRNEQLVAERELLREEANRAALLTQVNEQRSALLRSVSHDLRTPLGIIQAAASDLRESTTYPPDARDRLLDLVGDEAARLNRIVSNLLSMSRIETGSFEPDRQAVAIDELLTDRLHHLERILEGHTVHVEVPVDLPLVDADYSQLDQVITNLIENAARHTPIGSTITIEARDVAGMMEVTVSDNGPGIPANQRAEVFEPFHRGPGSSSSGLGLAICRGIVLAHGGTIGLVPSEIGASVRFTVPLHG